MRRLRAWLHRWRGLFRRRALEAEMNAELQAHVDGLTERNIAAGMSPAAARYAALRTFGGVAQIAERARDERRSVWLEQFGQDVRYTVRSLARSPSFTSTVVLTLALGIGVNAALFSVYNMVALRPLPVRDPEGLARIGGRDARGGGRGLFGHAEYVAYREGNRTLDGLIAFHETKAPFQFRAEGGRAAGFDESRPGAVDVEMVSENYFSVLGGTTQLGRTFLPEECLPGAALTIVLSDWFWERQLHRDPQALGTTLTLAGHVVTVIGIASPAFSGQSPIPPAGWLSMSVLGSPAENFGPTGPELFKLIGRLQPGITEAQAKGDLDAIAARRVAEFPGETAKVGIRLERGMRLIDFTRNARGMAAVGALFLGFAMVLVIACTNVANLLFARGVTRQAEIGVRLTLGAGRGRIVRQLLTENALLCVAGAVVGLGLALWTLQVLHPIFISWLPMEFPMDTQRLPFFSTAPDRHVLGFTALVALGATLVAGLLPALHAAGGNLIATIRNDGTALSRRFSPSRVRHWLVISQVAVCVLLLSCAGVLVRNFFVLQHSDVGFDADAVFRVGVIPNSAIADRPAAFRQALETLRTIPGVAGTVVAYRAPFFRVTTQRIRPVVTSGDGAEEEMSTSFITGDFFTTFEIPLLHGRTFRELEQQTASHGAIISESLARQLWPGQTAIGKTLAVSEAAWALREHPAPVGAFRECEVVGVARDVSVKPDDDDRRLLYLPFALEGAVTAPLFVRPRSDSLAARTEIVRAAQAGGVELQFDRRVSFFREQWVKPYTFLASVSGALGGLALVLASVGLYGVMTFAVNQRVREIGIRMALGATGQKVVTLFVRQGMRLVAVGLALGLIGGRLFSLALEKIMQGQLDTFDATAFAVVTLLFAIIALFACWLPARRATKVDPMTALRAE